MRLDRALTDREAIGDVTVREVVRHEHRHLVLAPGQGSSVAPCGPAAIRGQPPQGVREELLTQQAVGEGGGELRDDRAGGSVLLGGTIGVATAGGHLTERQMAPPAEGEQPSLGRAAHRRA